MSQARWFDAAAIRVLDVLLAASLLVVLAIPMVLLALAIKLGDGGPALFCQQRVGRRQEPFNVFKFRTMRVATQAAAFRTERGDPRITTLGRFLRPSHCDELPQLINVLAGQMSLVGVRPDTPMQRSDYSRHYWRDRHRYAPGITGPAQVARGDVTFAERSALEREWLDRRSLPLYLSILWQTVGKVFARSSN